MVKPSKDFPAGAGPNAPYEFGGACYFPAERKLQNWKARISITLRPYSARILAALLESYPEPVRVQDLHQALWPGTTEEQFRACFKTHLSTLKRSLYAAGLNPDVIDRGSTALSFRAKVSRGSSSEGLKVVGPVPRGAASEFRDRVAEREELGRLLVGRPNLRAVNVYGRFGVGKTALAYQVMTALLAERKVDGLVYLGPFTGLGLDQFYRHCALLMGGQPEHALREVWGNVQIPLGHKIRVLVEHLSRRRFVILLDSLEEMMSEGRLTDQDLSQFLDAFLQQPAEARLLITSNEPLYTAALDAQQFVYHFHLDRGLPSGDAVEFFKSLDYDGSSRFREIPAKLLEDITEKTQGFPRALKYVANILHKRPMLSLKDLLQKEHLFAAEITDKLSREAQASLGEEERRVMQALAVYNRPVGVDAVVFLVEPFMSARTAEEKLDRLARGKIINVIRDRGEIKCAINPWEAKLNYGEIPEGGGEHGRRRWHLRAADYYASIKPPAKAWRTLASLEPALAEFEHLVKAGSYERALAVVDAVDAHYLSEWGYHQRVISMRESLRDKFSDLRGAVNLRFLSSAYLNAGQYNMANALSKQALKLAREHGSKFEEAHAQLYAGAALYHLGHYKLAERHYLDALGTAREARNRPLEGVVLRHLGRLCRNLALHEKGLEFYHAALSIAVATHNGVAKCVALNGIGTAYTELGLFDEALESHNEALAIARDLNLKKAKGICLVQAGVALRESGDYERASESFAEALSTARELSDVVTEMQALGGLGKLRLLRSEFEEARGDIERALAIAAGLSMEGARQHWGTWLAQTYLHLGRLRKAARAVEGPREQNTPWNNYRTQLVDGIVLARSAGGGAGGAAEGARAAFAKASESADELLRATPTYYAARYTKFIAACGLALLSAGRARAARLREARALLKEARRRCSAPGVLDDFSNLFGELARADGEGALAAVSLAPAPEAAPGAKGRRPKRARRATPGR